jgi:hypothetical protein
MMRQRGPRPKTSCNRRSKEEKKPRLRLSSLREHRSHAKGHATDPEGFRTGGRYNTLAFFGATLPAAFSWSLTAFPARNRSLLLAGMLMLSPVRG